VSPAVPERQRGTSGSQSDELFADGSSDALLTARTMPKAAAGVFSGRRAARSDDERNLITLCYTSQTVKRILGRVSR
jgi:hypothetical protein